MAKTPISAFEPSFQDMPGHRIRRVQQVAVALFARALESYHITPMQYAALAALEQHGAMSQATLSALIAYDRATIGGVIDRLEAKGWLARSLDSADRRLRVVALTATGRKMLLAMRPLVQQVQVELLAPLSPAECLQFERICRKLIDYHMTKNPPP